MRNLCCKCPHYHEQHSYECDDVDWGCAAFGREIKNCPSFDDGEGNADFEEWGCNEKPPREARRQEIFCQHLLGEHRTDARRTKQNPSKQKKKEMIIKATKKPGGKKPPKK